MTLPEQINLEDYVAQLESEFSARYTDQDPDYTRTATSILQGDFNDPPIQAPWRQWEPRNQNNHAARGRNHRNNYNNDRHGNERFHSNDRRHGDGFHSNDRRHGDGFHSNDRRHGDGFQGNDRYGHAHARRPHHAKPYDRPRREEPRNRYDDRNRNEDRNRFEDRNRYNRYEGRYDRGRGRYGSQGGGGGEEEKRFGHQHDMKSNSAPASDQSEWS